MGIITDPWDHHDWAARDYVEQWASKQDLKEPDRREAFRVMADRLPYERDAKFAILDVGAGYGALTGFLLSEFPNARAVCHDGSAEMLALGRKRMAKLKARVKFVQSDLSKAGWSKKITGPFDAVVSSIAIHNVREHETICAIYTEIFSIVKPGGCFLNFDHMTPSLDQQLKWLGAAGFADVDRFWAAGKRAIVGGLRRSLHK